MSKVIIFGVKDFASLAHFYLKHDSKYEVAGFSVNRDFISSKENFEGLPVVPFEDVEKTYPPDDFGFFAPMSYRKMNRLRARVFEDVKSKGYNMISYIHSSSTVAPETKIGENCFILEDNCIQPFVEIGNDVMLWSGNQVSHHCTIQDHVFFGSQVAVSGHCRVDSYSFLGINSTVRENTNIKEGTLIAMGAVVTADTERWSIYKGIPAARELGTSKDFDI